MVRVPNPLVPKCPFKTRQSRQEMFPSPQKDTLSSGDPSQVQTSGLRRTLDSMQMMMHIARGCIFQPYIRAALPTWTRWCKLAIVLPYPDLSCMSGTCPNEIHVAHPLHWYGSVIVEMVLEHLWRRYRTHCCWSTTASSPPSATLTQNELI